MFMSSFCASIQKANFLPKPVDEAGKIGYNNIDVRNHLIYFNLV